MNTPHTHRSSRSRRSRKLAAAFGSLGLATTLAFSGLVGEGVTETEAAWTDTETATAEVKAAWLQGFTRVTNPGWRLQRVNPSDASIGTYGLESPVTVNRDFGLTYPQVDGYDLADGNEWRSQSIGDGSPSSDIVPERTISDDLWMGQYVSPGLFEYGIASASFCMSYPEPTQIDDSTTECFANPDNAPRIIAHQNTNGYTFSIESSSTKIARINASGFSSTAQCFSDGSSSASIRDDDAILNLANETTLGNGGYSSIADITDYIPETDSSDDRFDGTTNTWARYNVNGTNSARYVLLVNIRKNTYESNYYAIAEMDLVAQVYSDGGAGVSPGRYIGQINLPLTRSECGFSDGTRALPEMSGLWRGDPNQLPWPDPWIAPPNTMPNNNNGRLQEISHPAIPSSFMPVSMVPEHEALATGGHARAGELPPTTTVTSPTEHTTASETTTSAPPNPDDANESTSSTRATRTGTSASVTETSTKSSAATEVPTSMSSTSAAAPTSVSAPPVGPTTPTTSAAPAIVIPDEPGKLSPTARLEEVGTANVDEDDLVVVVKGHELPEDATQGVATLEIWLRGGSPGSTWETFASDDPDEDGWRWAAINQTTGTVVYIR